ncbi:MAG: ABC transporter permease [Proteobacteria bacterium]|nr:ABC transporter permease [Pseudomonadota bacterium]
MGIALWTIAYLRANPRQQCEEEYNSNWQIFLRLFRRHQAGMIGLYGVLLLILLTLLTPLLAPFDPIDIDTGPTSIGPCWNNLMGTDEYGRDVFSRVLFGGRISLSIGFIAVSIAASIGTSIGAIAGYLGGWVDRFLMFLVDMLLSLPRLVLLLAIVGVFRVQGVWGLFLIIFILGLTGWMGVSRIIRSQVLSLKQQDFIQAARALGMSSTRIIFRHLIPNAMAPVIVYCSLAIGTTIIAEAGLSFLGLGVPPPTSTWGTMVNDGRDPLRLAPWIALFPGLMIVGAVMSFNLLGDGLRDALDPKLRGH